MKAKYEEHKCFEQPDNEAKIWRYMSFTKFVSLLEKKALFFSRSDKLGDNFEGSNTQSNMELRKEQIEKDFHGLFPNIDIAQARSVTVKDLRQFIFINCWNLSDYESASLWRLYGENNQGIAIQSTFERLKICFSSEAHDSVFIGKVKYIDYTKDSFPQNNYFYPYVHKRKSFEHEQELRAIIMKYPDTSMFQTEDFLFKMGEYVYANLDTLIERVYIAPTAQLWFKELVKSIMEKYEVKLTLLQSNLDADPIY